MWSDGAARDLIKAIPILNSAAWPMHWIVVLLPLGSSTSGEASGRNAGQASPRVSATVPLFRHFWRFGVGQSLSRWLLPASGNAVVRS